jgi:hypothetical protein
MEEMRNSYKITVGKPEERISLGKNRHQCKDNIGIDLRETEWLNVVWILLAQDKYKLQSITNTVMNLWVP